MFWFLRHSHNETQAQKLTFSTGVLVELCLDLGSWKRTEGLDSNDGGIISLTLFSLFDQIVVVLATAENHMVHSANE